MSEIKDTVFCFDRFPIKNWEFDNSGNLRFISPIARSGDLLYLNDAGEIYTQNVPEKTLVNSLDTFKTKAITLLHPKEKVKPDNSMKYQRGLTGYTGWFDGNFLWLTGTATDKELITSIVNGDTREISPGYDALLQPVNAKRFIQLDRKGNHIAAVPKGRNGKDVKFPIEDSFTLDESGQLNYESSVYYLNDADEIDYEKLKTPYEIEKHLLDETKKVFDLKVSRTLILHGLI